MLDPAKTGGVMQIFADYYSSNEPLSTLPAVMLEKPVLSGRLLKELP
jgi:hypothetical protein